MIKGSENDSLPVAIVPDMMGTNTSFSERWKVVQKLEINCDVYTDESQCYRRNPVKTNVVELAGQK